MAVRPLVKTLVTPNHLTTLRLPAGLGVQEGGFVVLGMTLGFGPEVGLVLSLAKRFRELLVGLPGLVAWHLLEGHDLLRRRRDDSIKTSPFEEPWA